MLGAAKLGDYSTVEKLLEEGADPNYEFTKGVTPLSIAVINDHGNIVTLLLSKGASPVAALSLTNYDYGLLHLAAAYDSTDAAAALVQNGAEVDALNYRGFAPLHVAASLGFIRMATFLMDSGASVEVQSGNSWSPISFAVTHKQLSMVRFLLSRGANVNSRAEEDQFTPLAFAAWINSGIIIQELLDSGADIEAQTAIGATPLIIAAEKGHQTAIEILVGNGADKGPKFFGSTAREHLCACLSFEEVTEDCNVEACKDTQKVKLMQSLLA